jgi:hypothetical protein
MTAYATSPRPGDHPTPAQTRSRARQARPRHEPGRRARQRNPARFLRRAGFLLLLTWLPAAAGAVGAQPLATWAVAAGYLGVSWALPALLVRAAVRDWADNRGVPCHGAIGVIAGALFGVILLVIAAAAIGS